MTQPEANPILIVDLARILFIGPVESVATHKAMVPVFGAGLDSDFELTFDTTTWCGRTALVQANVTRAVQAFGKRLAVMPIDPVAAATCVREPERAIAALQQLAHGYDDDAWRDLAQAIGLTTCAGDFPPKLLRAMARISENVDENLPAEKIAAEIGLSVSRLQHLFRERVGTSMRTYRLWRRFRAVIQAMRSGRTLTDAAIAAGFFDSAHFGNAFKRTFGVTPSFVFSDPLHIHLVPRDDLASPGRG